MLSVAMLDHRRSTEQQLCEALAAGIPLALAEAYHRTSGAAHAAARRLVGPPDEVEALLHRTYTALWSEPPADAALEGWVRRTGFALATEHLRERQRPPAAPSSTVLLADIPVAAAAPRHDPVEGVLAGLDQRARCALVRAHDAGVASAQQQDPEAGAALEQALEALAGPALRDEEGLGGVPGLADWVLGLAEPTAAAALAAGVAERRDWAARARLLRRGRRRLEGLPPHPDLGHRVLVAVLTQVPHALGTPLAAAAHAAAAGPGVPPPAAAVDRKRGRRRRGSGGAAGRD